MKNTLETRLGVFFALAFIAAAIVLEMAGGMAYFKRGYTIHALFKNASELKVGDPVKLAGVPIGKVQAIGLTNDSVVITMKLNNEAVVKTDAKATIKFTGLMGQNFVAINIGAAKTAFVNGQFIDVIEPTDMSQIMLKLDSVATGIENVTKSFSGDSIQNILGPLTDFMKDNRNNLTAMIGNMKAVSQDFTEGRGTLGKLIKDDELYRTALTTVSNLNLTADNLKATLDGVAVDAKAALAEAKGTMSEAKVTMSQARVVVDDINAGKGTMGKLLKDERLYNETTESMMNLKEILMKMNKGQGTVGSLINDDSFLKNVKMSLQKVDKATEGLEDQGPLSVLGLAVNKLF